MRFFTPELYLRFNSPVDEEADRANEAWEEALQGYRSHLEALRERMPSQVSRLADLSLHDAQVLARSEEIQAGGPAFLDFPLPLSLWTAVAVVTLKREEEVISLIYCLWDRVQESPAPEGWRFSRAREDWLYDEVDVAPGRRGALFLHRILLSTGATLVIPFTSVVIHRFTLPAAGGEGVARRSA
jgi:hypothetical protein